MRVIGIITARGGSKGVPRKNLASISGRSLLSYTAESALGATGLTRVIISTDDEEIADEARRCGIDVPFMRPDQLAQDDTPTLPVLQHAVESLETGGDIWDAVCLLQPTHPFRRSEDIDRCIDLLGSTDADAVVTIARVPDHYNPHWVYWMDNESELKLSTGESVPIPRRQELPPAYHREGSVYVTRRDVLMNDHSMYGSRLMGVLVDTETRVNIDSIDDLQRAEAVLRQLETRT